MSTAHVWATLWATQPPIFYLAPLLVAFLLGFAASNLVHHIARVRSDRSAK